MEQMVTKMEQGKKIVTATIIIIIVSFTLSLVQHFKSSSSHLSPCLGVAAVVTFKLPLLSFSHDFAKQEKTT